MEQEDTVLAPTTMSLYVDGSCTGNPGPAGYGFYGIDNLKTTYHGYGPAGMESTNNIGELCGFIYAVKYALTYKSLKHIHVYSDSRYVVDGIHGLKRWENNNWRTSKGTTVANLDYWKQVKECLASCNRNGIKLRINWLRGHSGIEGNELSDKYANAGRIAMMQGDHTHVCNIDDADVCEFTTSTIGKKTIKAKSAKATKHILHPMINGKRWFFYTNMVDKLADGRYFYTTSTFPDTKKTANKHLGKRHADTSYSIFLTDKPIPELNSIREKFNEKFKETIVPTVINLQLVRGAKIWADMVENQNKFLTIKGTMAVTLDTLPIGGVHNPPKNAYKLEEIYRYGFNLLGRYEDNDTSFSTFDITDSFLHTTARQVQSFSPEFTQLTLVREVDNINLPNDVTVTAKVIVGVDMPTRLTMGALLKVSATPIKIILLVYGITEHSYRIATIIEADDNIAVYYAIDNNYRILN